MGEITESRRRVRTRVLILYNDPTLPADHPEAESEHEIVHTVGCVAKVLRENGFTVSKLGVHVEPGKLISGIRRARPDVVFNLFEGLPEFFETEAYAAGLLNWLGVPFTGCPGECITTARNKPLTKYLLRGAGLPTPEFFLVEDGPVADCPLEWPVIVKPAYQDASVGIDQASVVTDLPALRDRVDYVLTEYGPPVLVERYIAGREFNVGIAEFPDLKLLPVCEIKFDPDPAFWPITTYDAKWNEDSHDWDHTPWTYPSDLPPELLAKFEIITKKVFRLLGCRDLARVDYRVTEALEPHVLEVNPNPDFSPVAGMITGLEVVGRTHAQLTLQLVNNALARGGAKVPAPRTTELIPWVLNSAS